MHNRFALLLESARSFPARAALQIRQSLSRIPLVAHRLREAFFARLLARPRHAATASFLCPSGPFVKSRLSIAIAILPRDRVSPTEVSSACIEPWMNTGKRVAPSGRPARVAGGQTM